MFPIQNLRNRPCVFNCKPCKDRDKSTNSMMNPHRCKYCLGINVHKSQDCPYRPCVFDCASCTRRIGANGYVPAHVCRMCGVPNNHRTDDCKKDRSLGTSVLHIKSTRPHKKQSTLNAVVVVFTRINGSLHVLVQKRSPNGFAPIANKIGVPGGQSDHGDQDSRVAGAREILEEAGMVIDTKTLQVFHSTPTCNWLVALIKKPVFGKAIDAHECGNFNLSDLPHRSVLACFGHAWVHVNSLHQILASACIGGLHKRIAAARNHMGY
jgi:8-oxo-dGTP pyrophosphatase MutT (NUDIX family)